ncbi:MAG: hypothetical protein SAJ37_22615 [Oscillatoria sp. PMC 1068.18]|nr:hypothetical protein [Oscillatoria sp. PMC 1076.18]MEC4991538.1 hypothetical protein [Oscillatoria sp. PMC 1068.18]
METATRPNTLESLEEQLQKRLNSESLQIVPLQVRCLFRDETLTILVEHPEPVTPYKKRTFNFIEATLREWKTNLVATDSQVSELAGGYRVLMYLRVLGQHQPYAFHTVTISKPTLDETTPEAVAETESSTTDQPVLNEEMAELEELLKLDDEEDSAEENAEVTPKKPNFHDSYFLEDEELATETEEDVEENEVSQTNWLPIILAGVGIGLVFFLASLSFLNRPCVVGKCEALGVAKQLANGSEEILQGPTSGQAILNAQQQLDRSIDILDAIPSWSRHHSEAANLLKIYQPRAENLDRLVLGLQTGARTAYLTQNPPLPAEKWAEVQKGWEEAIALLESISPESDFYDFAQTKVDEYQKNLAVIKRRFQQEKEATANLKAAKNAAEIAEVRQGVAQTLANWQLVYTTWQTVAERLAAIPQGTTVYTEAQQLQNLSSPKLAKARDRQTQEQFGNNAYNQGIRLGKLAEEAEQTGQWAVASESWRDGLTYLKQVPDNTFYQKKAQSLIPTYSVGYEQAQEQLRIAIKLQQIKQELERTCSATSSICNYTITNNVVKVSLTPSYTQKLRQTAINAQTQGDYQTQVNLFNHVKSLEVALEAISNKSGTRVEVYTPDNVLIQTYLPE